MGDFYSHDGDPDPAYLARSAAIDLKRNQKQHADYIEWINDQLETMDNEQLKLMYNISYDVEEYKTFFRVLRQLK